MKFLRLLSLLFPLVLLLFVASNARAVESQNISPDAWSAALVTQPPIVSNWHIEMVDSPIDDLSETALAIDQENRPHIGYCNQGLKYARHDGTAWYTETVDSDETTCRYVSLALDGLGQPHISYSEAYTNSDLKYAWHDGSAWQSEVVATGTAPSLALDASGRPHISFQRNDPDDELRYAWHDGNAWQIVTVDGSRGRSSLALDEGGRPHIAYVGDRPDSYFDSIKYARHDGSTWHIEILPDSNWEFRFAPSLALDSAGRPHITYIGNVLVNSYMIYAWWDGTSWQIELVDATWTTSPAPLVLDSSDHPHATYNQFGSLRYARFDGSVWQTEPVDHNGSGSSLVLDASGQPRISYRHHVYESADDLMYARLMPLPLLNKQATPNDGLRHNGALTYTLTLSGPGLNVRLWDPLPPAVRYVSGSLTTTLTPAATYSATAHAIQWQGTLPTDTVGAVRFQVTPGITGTGSLSLTPPIVNTAWLTDTTSGLSVSATTIVNAQRVYLPLTMRSD